MSLRAKIEAVIYAAEEPVTLTQLTGIFFAEVPEEDTTPAATASESSVESLIEQGFAAASTPFGLVQDLADVALLPGLEESKVEAKPDPAAVEAEAKRATRQREREVREHLKAIIDGLIADYANGDRGMEIREVAGGYRIATKPEYHDAVRGFVKSLKPPMKLSLQALETLAVIAYKQPVTAPEVGEIRGVDSGGVLGGLISRKLITTAGRKQVIGRPILYKTTREFLLRFGLKDINELPSIEEFEKLAGDIEIGDEDAREAFPGNLPFEESGVAFDAGVDADDEKAFVPEPAVDEDAALVTTPGSSVVEAEDSVEGLQTEAIGSEVHNG